MSHLFINQIRENDKIDSIYRLSSKQLRPNKNGNLYLQFDLSDKTGTVSARFWSITAEQAEYYENNGFVHVVGDTQRFQGNLQLIARKMTPVGLSDVNLADYESSDKVDVPKRKARLQEILRTITQPDLLNLADCFLADEAFMYDFCRAPAGIKLHHACIGGLLDHTTQMVEVAAQIAALYPQLNRSLLIIGAFLHDIGKTKELGYENDFYYANQGQMLGHPVLGLEILIEKIREAETLTGEKFDEETAMMLKHLVLSHHGAYENQSVKLPMTLEAIALHYIDSLDSKVAEFQKYMRDDSNLSGVWTNYIPAIDRKLYKGNTEQ